MIAAGTGLRPGKTLKHLFGKMEAMMYSLRKTAQTIRYGWFQMSVTSCRCSLKLSANWALTRPALPALLRVYSIASFWNPGHSRCKSSPWHPHYNLASVVGDFDPWLSLVRRGARVHVCMYIKVCVCVCAYVCACACVFVHERMHVQVCVFVCACSCVLT